MPTFYEGSPIVECVFSLTKEEYSSAYYAAEISSSFLKRREVKCGICIALILLAASLIPGYYSMTRGFLLPAAVIVVLSGVLVFFLVFQPKNIMELAGESFSSNRLLSEVNTVLVYRDSLIYKNAYEEIRAYWTDFERCAENKEYIILIGGERNVLIIKKTAVDIKTAERLSSHMMNTFASKYTRIK